MKLFQSAIAQLLPEKIYSDYRAEKKSKCNVILNSWRYLLKYAFHKRKYDVEYLEMINDSAHLLNKFSSPKKTKTTIGIAGDLMWVKYPAEKLEPELHDRMSAANFWIANLETPLVSDKHRNSVWPDRIKYGSGSQIIRIFRNSHQNRLGIVSLANNHITDRNDKGIDQTLKYLQKEEIFYSGLGDDGCVKQINGLKIGFYSLTYGINNTDPKSNFRINVFDFADDSLKQIREVLEKLKRQGTDLNLISFHWGHEFEFVPTKTQVDFAEKLALMGWDIIAGHHPHVIQPVQVFCMGGYEKSLNFAVNKRSCLPYPKRKKVLVFYSLGNFMTDMLTRHTQTGLAVVLGICKNGEGADWHFKDYFLTKNHPSGFSRKHRLTISESKLSDYHKEIFLNGKTVPDLN